MVTKWKKWSKRGVCAVAAHVAGLSLLLAGGAGIFGGRGPEGTFLLREFNEEDYQETAAFRDFISERLNDFLDMACNDYVSSGYAYEASDAYSGEAFTQALADGTYDISQEQAEEAEAEAEEAEEDLDEYWEEWERKAEEGDFSEKEKKEIAKRFHESIRGDKNLLYRISYDGKALGYDNTGEKRPETDTGRYNFHLHYDGGKVSIEKDGKELDVYGDGIYREGNGWRLPGYQNLTGKGEWKKAEVHIWAAKEPVVYGDSLYGGDYSWRSDALYYLYKNHLERRRQLKCHIACACAGILLLVLYFLLKKEKGEASRALARLTAKMWFEWKALLFLLLPVLILAGLARQARFELAYADLGYDFSYVSNNAAEYFSELSAYAEDVILDNMSWLLLSFWLFYLFFNDLARNKGSYGKGAFGKLFAVYEERSLKLPLSKRLAGHSCGVFFVTAAQFFTFLFLLSAILILNYRFAGGGALEAGFICLLALAFSVLLLLFEYHGQKKIKRLSAGVERLSDRLSKIRAGGYAASEDRGEFDGEDADIRRMADDLESIRQGLETAVEERIGSERMKVELLANVSHDIKTPLTSIISYIQLLGQEEGLPEHVKDYIRILDEKSERLKTMVQDVFAVSKAVSGQLSVECKELDLGKLLQQTLADMEEMIAESPVALKAEIPAEPVTVWADGERMYRVFQNLIANALKYSLDGSRVYVTLKTDGKMAAASVKNTSSQELNQDIDFAERFTRGDKSRTDGGSGLGLSIAKSFTEACGGTFSLETIADLFVVTVEFDVYMENGFPRDSV